MPRHLSRRCSTMSMVRLRVDLPLLTNASEAALLITTDPAMYPETHYELPSDHL